MCGLADPRARPTRGWGVAVVATLLIALAAAAAWKLGFLDGRRQNASAAAVVDSAALQSGLRSSVRKTRRRDPPRIKSARYPAPCRSPAPVLVYALERMPKTFFVRLAGGIPNPDLMTDSLVNRYKLQSNGYEPAWNALYVKDTPPNIVSALRCEALVNSIEEVAYNEMGDIR